MSAQAVSRCLTLALAAVRAREVRRWTLLAVVWPFTPVCDAATACVPALWQAEGMQPLVKETSCLLPVLPCH